MVLHKSVHVVDGLRFYVWQGRGNNCNAVLFPGILRGTAPHVIIDPGAVNDEAGEMCYESLAGAMERDGFKVSDVGLVLNTHYHTDHYAAGEIIQEKGGAKLAMTREDQEWGRTLSEHVYAAFGAAKPKYQPFFYLKEGMLDLGAGNRLTIQVIATPGHSAGSVSFYWPEKKVLVTGDVVFYGSIGRTDFPGGNSAALKKSIQRLSELDVEYLLPGHSTEYGSIISGKSNITRNFQSVKLFI
jgi:glyoxylase-like metal-dependent hydrolase (beta-lactamase superfamily II)